MRKTVIYAIIGIGFIMFSGFIIVENFKNSYAEVNQLKGYYIFVDSRPLHEYEYLGEVKGPGVGFGSGQYSEVRNKMIDRLAKEYPKADGIILHFQTGAKDRAEAIKFKD